MDRGGRIFGFTFTLRGVMNKAFVRESDAPPPRCPNRRGCGTVGIAVTPAALAAHTDAGGRKSLTSDAFYCPNQDCAVAYFDAWGGVVPVEAARGLPYPKHPDGPVCACLDIGAGRVVAEARAGDKTTVARIIAHSKGADASCATTMADGRSCERAVRRLFLDHRMVLLALVVGAMMLFPVAGSAQPGGCPDPGTVLFAGTEAGALQDSLRSAFRPPVGLSYGDARDVMFSEIDNFGGSVTGIYTGFTVSVDPESGNPRGDAFDAGINTEHTWPQSKGAENLPARADLHHLFPSEIDANNARASFPFDEIPDEATDSWYRLKEVTGTPDPGFIDEYSELDRAHPDPGYEGRWEPREDRKGDIARAMFYFYTMYRPEADAEDNGYFDVQKDRLRVWHQEDPVDTREYERTCAIAPHQAGKVNPFVIDASLVDRAYFDSVPVELAYFRGGPVENGVRLVWDTGIENAHAGFHVHREFGGAAVRLTAAMIPPADRYVFFDRTGTGGREYAYRLEAVARDGSRQWFGPVAVPFPAPAFSLSARPNPFRAGETVHIDVAGGARERAEVFDLAGRRLRTWPAGFDGVWDGRLDTGETASPGIYFFRAAAGDRARTIKLVLIR